MITIDYQIAVKETAGLPEEADLVKYAETAARDLTDNASMTVRIADEDESHALNMEYRHVDRPTNVLSFPYELPEDLPPEALADFPENYLGDLVICKSVVEREAQEQNKTPEEHWARASHGRRSPGNGNPRNRRAQGTGLSGSLPGRRRIAKRHPSEQRFPFCLLYFPALPFLPRISPFSRLSPENRPGKGL